MIYVRPLIQVPRRKSFLNSKQFLFFYKQKQAYVSWKEGQEVYLINKMPYAPFY